MSMTQLKRNTLMNLFRRVQFYYTINIFPQRIFGIFLSTLHGIVSVNFTLFITFCSASEASHKTISGMFPSACNVQRFKLNTWAIIHYLTNNYKNSCWWIHLFCPTIKCKVPAFLLLWCRYKIVFRDEFKTWGSRGKHCT